MITAREAERGARARAGGHDAIAEALSGAVHWLVAEQSAAGYWCYEFEADCTIAAEYILLAHFTGETQFTDTIAPDLEARIGNYLRRRQRGDGGWPLYPGGAMDISCSVKAYYALKLIGDGPECEHMARARAAILARGGAIEANVFTRITLALYEQVPWRAVPVVPVELILFPDWMPINVHKVSYWSRTVTVPLSVLCSLKPAALNPRGIGIEELFVRPASQQRTYFRARSPMNRFFLALDALARRYEPLLPAWLRQRALAAATDWFIERANGVHGLGAIFPAMVNAYEAMVALGFPAPHPARAAGAEALKRLVVLHEDQAYCQPCVSPIWDTGLATLALAEAGPEYRARGAGALGGDAARPARHPSRRLEDSAALALDDPLASGGYRPAQRAGRLRRQHRDVGAAMVAALDWCAARQLRDEPGDWQRKRPTLPGGGWAFEFANPHYPDVDDTALLGWGMLAVDRRRYATHIERAAVWVAGMQSSCGGFAAFDVDNCDEYLNQVPFADHGALLDPPTSDVSARCVGFLARYDAQRFGPTIARALDFLADEREPEGCWFGRWGTNYIYGTWSVLSALESVLAGPLAGSLAGPRGAWRGWVDEGANWLVQCQRDDGGWGESNDSYIDRTLMGCADASTSFHTAWAMLALLAAGRGDEPSLARGAEYLRATQRDDGLWYDEAFTCPGFPRVFYLKYHGYSKYFPLWALARYQALRRV